MRSQRVMLDADLAELYGVETRVLVQAIKRNAVRFPVDFMFQLSVDEFANLRSQIATSSL
jgi:ORF6N domain